MPKPTDVTTHDGKPVDWLTHYALCLMELDLGYPLTVVQGHHIGTPQSANTHDRWGVVDLAPWDWRKKIAAGDKVGFVLHHRLPSQGPWNEHVHGNLVADFNRMSPSAQRQVSSYRNGRDGLKSNRVDPTKRTRPFVELQWPGSDQALAVEKKANALRAPVKPVVTATGLRVDGLDLSHHNVVTQAGLNQAALLGAKYAYLKATEGTTFKDPAYPNSRAMVRKANLVPGAYHFAGPETKLGDAAAEARAFLAYAKPAAGDMRPVLDLEKMGGLNQAQLTAWVGEWVGVVKATIGVLPVIYTPFRLNDNFGCMLWVARYSNDNAAPKIPAPWTRWRMRQFSDGKFGKPNQIAGMHVDLNTLHDGEDFDWLRIPVKAVPEPQPPVVVTPPPVKPAPVEPAPATNAHKVTIQVTLTPGNKTQSPASVRNDTIKVKGSNRKGGSVWFNTERQDQAQRDQISATLGGNWTRVLDNENTIAYTHDLHPAPGYVAPSALLLAKDDPSKLFVSPKRVLNRVYLEHAELTGTPLAFLGTHLVSEANCQHIHVRGRKWREKTWRIQKADVIAELKRLHGLGLPIVLAGDFNTGVFFTGEQLAAELKHVFGKFVVHAFDGPLDQVFFIGVPGVKMAADTPKRTKNGSDHDQVTVAVTVEVK